MEIYGSLATNLAAALQSANRLRNRPVYTGTLEFWDNLVTSAYQKLAEQPESELAGIRKQIAELEQILTERRAAPPMQTSTSAGGDETSIVQ